MICSFFIRLKDLYLFLSLAVLSRIGYLFYYFLIIFLSPLCQGTVSEYSRSVSKKEEAKEDEDRD